jgi:hypothetical protein
MSQRPREIEGRDVASAEAFLREVQEPCRPVVLRGLVGDWPLTRAGRESPQAFSQYLRPFDAGKRTEAFYGDSAIAGRYYYTDDLAGFNFERRPVRFADVVDEMVATIARSGAPSIYLGSVPANDYLPGLSTQNVLPFLAASVQPRIWLGTAANVAPHYDALDNVACVVAGHRRFTLYPPEAIRGLYVGPVDHTMAGQPVGLAAAGAPDDTKYPRFRDVQSSALVAELGPGDALYLPKLWWHKVESTAPFNGLVNYWWDAFSSGPDAPYTSLLLSMITIAERPAAERRAWQAFFEHYVFRPEGHPLAHLPAERHGLLGALQPENYRKIRARVMYLLRGG